MNFQQRSKLDTHACEQTLHGPRLLLSRATGSVRTQGAKKTFTDTDAAINALRTGNVEMIVGALPFNPDEAVALTEPASIIREDGPLEPHAYYRQGTLNARVTGFDPEPEEHLRRVDAAIATIQSSKLDKVVLARGVDIEFAAPVDPDSSQHVLSISANRDGFIADLSSRTSRRNVGRRLPEVLVKKQGSTVTAFPLAGSAPRQADKARDHLAGQDLLRSAKDLHEHAFVVDHLRRILSPLCTTLDAPTTPELINTNEMWHLGTPIA